MERRGGKRRREEHLGSGAALLEVQSSEEQRGAASSPSFLLLRSTQLLWQTPALWVSLHLSVLSGPLNPPLPPIPVSVLITRAALPPQLQGKVHSFLLIPSNPSSRRPSYASSHPHFRSPSFFGAPCLFSLLFPLIHPSVSDSFASLSLLNTGKQMKGRDLLLMMCFLCG